MYPTTDYLTEIQKYVQYVRTKIKIEKVVLFGSYAQGTATADSDIDLAVVSPDFGKSLLREKMDLFGWRHHSSLTADLQPFPFSPEQFAADHFFVEEIRKTGIDITDQVL